MIFDVRFRLAGASNVFPLHYHYPLSAIIYKVMNVSDPVYTKKLHDFGISKKRYKLFTFSDLQGNFTRQGNTLVLHGNEVVLRVCFQLSDAAMNFLNGLMQMKVIELYSKGAAVKLEYLSINSDKQEFDDSMMTLVVETMSPLVCGIKKPWQISYQNCSPYDPLFYELLLTKLVEKYRQVYHLQAHKLRRDFPFKLIPIRTGEIRQRTIVISERKKLQSIVTGYHNMQLQITCTGKMAELALNTGLGMYNAIGCGCVKLIDRNDKQRTIRHIDQYNRRSIC